MFQGYVTLELYSTTWNQQVVFFIYTAIHTFWKNFLKENIYFLKIIFYVLSLGIFYFFVWDVSFINSFI